MQQNPTHLDQADARSNAPPEPPPPPRDLTPKVRRRAWRERHVRLWLILGLALLAITLYYALTRSWWWYQEKRLIETGLPTQAEIMGAWVGQDWPPGKVLPHDTQVDILYTVNGKTYRPHAALPGRKEQIRTRTFIPIYVDKSNPQRWTSRTQPASLAHELLGAAIIAPGAILLLAVAFLKRRQVLSIYRDGQPVLAQVIGIGQTPSAPLSRLIRCAIHEGDSAKMIKTILPAHQNLKPGDLIWLITPPGKTEPAIPAAHFE